MGEKLTFRQEVDGQENISADLSEFEELPEIEPLPPTDVGLLKELIVTSV